MDLLIKRNFWMLPIVTVVVCAVMSASAANHLIDASLLPDEVPAAQAARKAPRRNAAPPPAPTKDVDALVARNIFCSECAPPATPAPTDAPHDDGRPQPTSLPLTLVATVVAGQEASATITNTTTGRGGSYRVDDVIPDAGEIERIGVLSVDFKNRQNGRVERISLVAQAAAPPRAPAVAAAAPPAAPGEPDLNVRQVSENRYEVDRGVVEKLIADPVAASRFARFMPVTEDGKPAGFRLAAVRPSSPLAKIGLKNGDRIQAINGYELTSLDKALEAYTKLRTASNLTVALSRNGNPMNLEVALR